MNVCSQAFTRLATSAKAYALTSHQSLDGLTWIVSRIEIWEHALLHILEYAHLNWYVSQA